MKEIGQIESEYGTFSTWHTVWIKKDRAYLTKDLDHARIMSMLAKICNKLKIKIK